MVLGTLDSGAGALVEDHESEEDLDDGISDVFKSQSDSFIETLRIANNFRDTSLITRADLIFIKKIPLNRLDKNSFLFQWKHFHDFKIKEVPDQLHFIGENQIKNIYKVLLITW